MKKYEYNDENEDEFLPTKRFLEDWHKQDPRQLNRPYFPRHLKSLKLRSIRRCYEQAATLHGRIQTGRRQAGD